MSTNTEIIKNSDLQSLINDKRRLINEIKDFNKSIKPLEFESYQDYFLIKTFKKGISASGHVDIDSLRNKEYGIYYKKIKRNSTQEVGEPILATHPPPPLLLDQTHQLISAIQNIQVRTLLQLLVLPVEEDVRDLELSKEKIVYQHLYPQLVKRMQTMMMLLFLK